MQPGTSKGITDLLLLLFVRLRAADPAKKTAAHAPLTDDAPHARTRRSEDREPKRRVRRLRRHRQNRMRALVNRSESRSLSELTRQIAPRASPPRVLQFHLLPQGYPRPHLLSVRLSRRNGLTRRRLISIFCRKLSITVGRKDRQESGLEHSGFLTVAGSPNVPRLSMKRTCMTDRRNGKGFDGTEAADAAADGSHTIPLLDYERFNRNNFSIRFRSWYYRGCWHQTCPALDPR